MKIAVIYASKYGSTETYARWIAEELDAGLYLVKAVSAEMLQDYDAVIYGGGLYAGGVDEQILETYGKDVNLIGRASIEPIVAYVRAL